MTKRSSPFFIIGHPRSGTTLLRMILCTHSRIYIPEESGFIPFLQVDPNIPLTGQEISRLLDRIGELNAYWRNVLTADEIERKFPRSVNLGQVLDALYSHLAHSHGAKRWGDKTPLYVQYMPAILEIFPDACFIHLIRDGRDAALSARSKWAIDNFYMDLFYLLSNWKRNVRTGRQHGHRLQSSQYLELYYEELVSRPEMVLRRLCNFLGESYEPSMLDHTQAAKKIGPGHAQHQQVMQPLFKTSIGRWKNQFTLFERKLSERLAGDCLAEFGYSHDTPGRMSAIEEIQYFGLAVKYFLFDTLRTLLYRLGWLTLNRSMRRPKPDPQNLSQ